MSRHKGEPNSCRYPLMRGPNGRCCRAHGAKVPFMVRRDVSIVVLRIAGREGSNLRRLSVAILVVALAAPSVWGKTIKLSVRVVGMQNHETRYSFVVPGYSNTNCNAYGYGNSASVGCYSSGMQSFAGGYEVRGATLALLLPDSRIVVVNCDQKTNWTSWKPVLYRSCRIPLRNTTIQALFNGDKAKLIWSVSLDGKKKESETYKILGILSKSRAGAEAP